MAAAGPRRAGRQVWVPLPGASCPTSWGGALGRLALYSGAGEGGALPGETRSLPESEPFRSLPPVLHTCQPTSGQVQGPGGLARIQEESHNCPTCAWGCHSEVGGMPCRAGRRGHWEPLRIRLTAMLMAGRFAHDTTALPLDVTVLPQSPQTPTRHLSPAAQALPVTPDRTLKGRDWTLSHRPTEPRKHVYCSSGSYCCVGSAVVCAQLSAGSRKDTTAKGRKPNLCSPQERAWLGEARVVCKAQARGSEIGRAHV